MILTNQRAYDYESVFYSPFFALAFAVGFQVVE